MMDRDLRKAAVLKRDALLEQLLTGQYASLEETVREFSSMTTMVVAINLSLIEDHLRGMTTYGSAP